MSNGVYVPRRRSFFGPLFLIGLGVIFLLVNIGQLSMHTAFMWFAKYWPLLLILWGVVRLVEHAMAKKDGLPAPGIGAAGGFLLVLIVLCGLTATGFLKVRDNVNWGAIREEMDVDDDGFSRLFGVKKEFDDEQQHDVAAAVTSIVISNERGTVKVYASTDGKLRIKRHLTVYAKNDGEADKLKDQVPLNVTTEGSTLRIGSERNQGGRVDLEIYAPANAAVEIMTLRGTVDVRDRNGNVKAHNSRGDVTLEGIKGNAEVHLRSGSFVAKKVTGDVSLEGRVNDTTVQDVSGTATMNGEFFGEMEIARVGKGVRFKSNRTDFEIGKLEGEFRMGGDNMRANNFAGPMRLVTRSKDVHFEDFTGDVRLENTNGEVELHPKTPVGNLAIENRRGRIQLYVPENAGFQIDANARRGRIETDFDLKTEGERGDHRATGTVGKGGGKVQLTSDGGEIEIRKG